MPFGTCRFGSVYKITYIHFLVRLRKFFSGLSLLIILYGPEAVSWFFCKSTFGFASLVPSYVVLVVVVVVMVMVVTMMLVMVTIKSVIVKCVKCVFFFVDRDESGLIIRGCSSIKV